MQDEMSCTFLNSPTKHTLNTTTSSIYNLKADLIEDKIQIPNYPYTDISIPKELKGYFQNLKPYVFTNGTLNLGKYNQALSTNGKRLMCGRRKESYPKRGPNNNELTESQIAYLDSKTKPHYETQFKIYEKVLSQIFHELNAGQFDVLFDLKRIEFYLEYPIPPQDETFFNSVKAVLCKDFAEATEFKNKTGKQFRRQAEWEFNHPKHGKYRIKFYQKSRTFRLEIRFVGLPRKILHSLPELKSQYLEIAQEAFSILKPCDEAICVNLKEFKINPEKIWEILKLIGFRGRLRNKDEWKRFVEHICEHGTYTPSKVDQSLRLSYEQIIRLCDPSLEYFEKVNVPHSNRIFIRLHPEWNKPRLTKFKKRKENRYEE